MQNAAGMRPHVLLLYSYRFFFPNFRRYPKKYADRWRMGIVRRGTDSGWATSPRNDTENTSGSSTNRASSTITSRHSKTSFRSAFRPHLSAFTSLLPLHFDDLGKHGGKILAVGEKMKVCIKCWAGTTISPSGGFGRSRRVPTPSISVLPRHSATHHNARRKYSREITLAMPASHNM